MATAEEEVKLATEVLNALAIVTDTVTQTQIDEDKARNASSCMTAFICDRLNRAGSQPVSVERTTFSWANGIINIRNAVQNHLWTNLRPTFIEKFESLCEDKPAIYLMVAWQPSHPQCHAWVIPAGVVHEAIPHFPVGKLKDKRTVRIIPGKNVFERYDGSPDLTPFYRTIHWTEEERVRLVEAAKIDEAARKRNRGEKTGDDAEEEEQEESGGKDTPGFTTATVDFVLELPSHATDSKWHKENKERYQTVLRDPTKALVSMLRDRYIERLSPEVAGGTRHLSILKKNDFGKGGYYPHYWFAFYDPAAGSKTKSVQLFFTMVGNEQEWRYGFSMGNYCEPYLQRLSEVLKNGRDEVIAYLQTAPEDTRVRIFADDEEKNFSPEDFAKALASQTDSSNFGMEKKVTRIDVVRVFPISTLPDHDDTIVDEVGSYFTWVWPLFEASISGVWSKAPKVPTLDGNEIETEQEVDEDAPETLGELSAATALPVSFLEQMEEALLAKQQAVLIGPPGTSKTYIARQFARYFIRQRPGRPQGCLHELYMHANWTYEDFFEGLKPTTSTAGQLVFEAKKGFFLEWVEQLKEVDPSAYHVLVLDELNRCDTAAVLGELLQLLEYRGTTIRLLSGRRFVFPRNLFILGTMNSADRSIGRMDFALRRRFLWLDLYPNVSVLKAWLARPGNNPVGFSSESLSQCNDILASHGITKEQHVGHALFMTQESAPSDGESFGQDVPLTERHLRRIVNFSVLPYVKELFLTQFGQIDAAIMKSIENALLGCIPNPGSGTQGVEDGNP